MTEPTTQERTIPETWARRYADVSVEEVYVNFLDRLALGLLEDDYPDDDPVVTLLRHIDRVEGRRPLTDTDLAVDLERFLRSGMYAFDLN